MSHEANLLIQDSFTDDHLGDVIHIDVVEDGFIKTLVKYEVDGELVSLSELYKRYSEWRKEYLLGSYATLI